MHTGATYVGFVRASHESWGLDAPRIEAVHASYARGYRVNGDLMKSRAQPVQWDFAQLDDWFNVIVPRALEHRVVTGAGIDVMRNRIRLNTDVEQRPALRSLLASLRVPCYMVAIEPGLRTRRE